MFWICEKIWKQGHFLKKLNKIWKSKPFLNLSTIFVNGNMFRNSEKLATQTFFQINEHFLNFWKLIKKHKQKLKLNKTFRIWTFSEFFFTFLNKYVKNRNCKHFFYTWTIFEEMNEIWKHELFRNLKENFEILKKN